MEPGAIDVTLEQLADEFSIIGKSPAWSAFSAGDTRFDQGDKYPEMESDAANIVAYSKLLQNSAPLIAQSLSLAADLSRFSPANTAGQRFRDGLRVLSDGLSLHTSTEQTTAERIAAAFAAAFPGMTPPQINDGDNDLAAWAKWMKSVLRRPMPDAKAALNDVYRGAWSAWEKRLTSFVYQDQPGEPADIDYLRCLAGRALPATILTSRLGEATLCDWSDALVKTICAKAVEGPDYCPLWFGVPVLAALGYGAYELDTRLVPDAQIEEKQALERLVKLASTPNSAASDDRGLLIVRAETNSVTAAWQRKAGVAAIAMTKANLAALMGQLRFGLFLPSLSPLLSGMLVEVTTLPDEPVSKQKERILAEVKSVIETFSGAQGVRIGVIARRPLTVDIAPYWMILDPKDLEDAANKLFAVARPLNPKS